MKKLALMLVLFCMLHIVNAADYQAGEAKSALCVACHGTKGISSNPEWPSLAGQHRDYLAKQLRDFKKGTRPSELMTAIVATLSDADIENLADYYANQPLPKGVTPKQYLKRGEQLYRGGDFKKHITACIACHGPRGLGNAQAMFPVLSGQQAVSTINELEQFKQNKRRNDLHAIMRDISKNMDKEDMEAVAYYVSGLH